MTFAISNAITATSPWVEENPRCFQVPSIPVDTLTDPLELTDEGLLILACSAASTLARLQESSRTSILTSSNTRVRAVHAWYWTGTGRFRTLHNFAAPLLPIPWHLAASTSWVLMSYCCPRFGVEANEAGTVKQSGFAHENTNLVPKPCRALDTSLNLIDDPHILQQPILSRES